MTDLVDLSELEGEDLQARLGDAVTGVSRDRAVDSAPQVTVTLRDPQRRLVTSPLLQQVARLDVDGVAYRLVQARKSGSQLSLSFEDDMVAALRKATGYVDAAAGTTRRSEFVRRLLDGAPATVERSPESTKVQLARGQEEEDDGEEESSWEAVGRLAEDIGWRWFVDGGRGFFVPDEALRRDRDSRRWREHDGPVGAIDYDLDVRKPVDSASTTVRANPGTVNPGDPITVDGLGDADGGWIVKSVREQAGSSEVSVDLTRPQEALEEPDEEESADA